MGYSNIRTTKIINIGKMRGELSHTETVVEFSAQRVLGRFEHLIREYARSMARNACAKDYSCSPPLARPNVPKYPGFVLAVSKVAAVMNTPAIRIA